jgi:hypothetical protein
MVVLPTLIPNELRKKNKNNMLLYTYIRKNYRMYIARYDIYHCGIYLKLRYKIKYDDGGSEEQRELREKLKE